VWYTPPRADLAPQREVPDLAVEPQVGAHNDSTYQGPVFITRPKQRARRALRVHYTLAVQVDLGEMATRAEKGRCQRQARGTGGDAGGKQCNCESATKTHTRFTVR